MNRNRRRLSIDFAPKATQDGASMTGILEELSWRGLVDNTTDEEALGKRLETPTTLYCGFDPTADSLHVGNLVPLLALRRFQLLGHSPIALAGGATGSIGDPSGKSAERQLLTRDILNANIAKVKTQLARLLDFETEVNPARLLDNADWTAGISYLDFLRDVGKHFSVNMMVSKESVRARMEDRETGISYTEFSYMLLQAFDFYHLRNEFNCEIQIGGSDQWGNITAGIELSRKKLSQTVYGITLPLITNSDGSKFGKTAAGAIWLDPNKTSVYRFYQFWIRTDDRDVLRYLKYFTFLSQEEIADLEQQHAEAPERRTAQKALAIAMTTMIHGQEATDEALKASQILFGGDLQGITEATFNDIINEIPSVVIPKENLENDYTLVDLVVEAKLCPSKGQARKDIAGGGINLNNNRQQDPLTNINSEQLLFGRFILLRKGKKNYLLASFE